MSQAYKTRVLFFTRFLAVFLRTSGGFLAVFDRQGHNMSITHHTQNTFTPSFGETFTFGAKKGNPTCPLSDLYGFYQDYLTGTKTTEVGQADGGIDWYTHSRRRSNLPRTVLEAL